MPQARLFRSPTSSTSIQSYQGIVDGVSELLRDAGAYEAMARATNPYGDGQAAGRILTRIREHFATSGP